MPRMLVVEDQVLVARNIERRVRPGWSVVCSDSCKAALSIVDDGAPLGAAVVDLGLPDGDGMDLVAMAGVKRPGLPILIVTARFEEDFVNRAAALGASYSCKPDYGEALLSFARRALIGALVRDEAVRGLLETKARGARLSMRETQIAVLSVTGTARCELAERCGVAENTLKTEIRSILHKCSVIDLEQLRDQVHA
jgi:two-component system, NarL family, nitrate/nitrite response regulator NarL